MQPSIDSTEIIKEFRYHIGHLLSFTLSDLDCLRFLHARQCSIEKSVHLALQWDGWRHQLLPVLPRTTLQYSPNIILSSYCDYFSSHPQIDLIPCMHHGWDKESRPIFWVKLGYIQGKFNDILKSFSTEDLTQYHLVMQELFEIRYEYMYRQHQKTVTNSVVVFDMSGFDRVTLDMDAVWMLKSWIRMDQNFYPERLHRLYIVHTPWYFSSLLGMFQPFIDKKTRKKIRVFQGDFLPALTEHIGIATIPEELGGTSKVSYCGPRSETTGVSPEQIDEYVREELLSPECTRVMTSEEDDAVLAIRNHAERAKAVQLDVVDTQASICYSAGLPPSLASAMDSGPVSPEGRNRNSDLGIEMAFMSSVFRVNITGVVKLPTHEEYVIDIEYDGKFKWQVQHRFADFVKFRRKITNILPSSARKTLPMLPPKVLFSRRSSKVVEGRRIKLQSFLSSLLTQIRSEASFDGIKLSSRREEEHQLFLFLDAYKALQSYVEDTDYTSDEDSMTGGRISGSFDESFRGSDLGLMRQRASSSGSRVISLVPDPSSRPRTPPHGGPLDDILHTKHRRVSAALLSVCILVLSFMLSHKALGK